MRCMMCGRAKQAHELIGGYCSRCDHIYGEVMADLQAEFGPGAV